MSAADPTTTAAGSWPVLPDPSFPPLRPFWEGAAAGELRFPRCGQCDTWVWYPQERCRACGGPLAWQTVRPTGRVYTATTVHHAFLPEYRPLLPLHLALVEPDDCPGVRLVTRLAGDRVGAEVIGAPVRIRFERVGDGTALPVAVPDGEAR